MKVHFAPDTTGHRDMVRGRLNVPIAPPLPHQWKMAQGRLFYAMKNGWHQTELRACMKGENIFLAQPEFIAGDPRSKRKPPFGYNINPAFALARHQVILPRALIKGRSVLDLGSCNAAAGAWCLSNGAKHYHGVEFQEAFVAGSVATLSKYYPREQWDIEQNSIERYLATNKSIHDVVLASGVLYGFADPVSVLYAMAEVSRALIIESMHPDIPQYRKDMDSKSLKGIRASAEYVRFIENEPFISLGMQGMVVPGEKTARFIGTRPSMGAIKFLLGSAGFRYLDAMNQRLKQRIPNVYSPHKRFGLLFVRKAPGKSGSFGFMDAADAGFGRVSSWKIEK